jgi:hypothetical protein
MSVDWATKKQALRVAVARCLRLDETGSVLLADGTYNNGFNVAFEHERTAGGVVGDIYAHLKISAVNGSGYETRGEVIDGGTPATSGTANVYGGPRTFVLTVKIVSNDQTDPEAVGTLGGMLVTRLRRPDVQETLYAADMALARVLLRRNDDYMDKSRWYSQCTVDLLMNTTEEDISDTIDPDLSGIILEVHGEGEPEIADVDLDVGPVAL